jgi:protein-arginine kinase
MEAAKANADWPSGRAIFVSKEKNLIIEVNHIDHLVIKYKKDNTSLIDVLDRLKILNDIIEGLI